jgi:cellulase/cellobiase CelA1
MYMEASLRGDWYLAMFVQINEKAHDVVQGSPTSGEAESQGQ